MIWKITEGESDSDYEKFLIYKNLGPQRSLGMIPYFDSSVLFALYEQFDWKIRAEAWDNHMAEINEEAYRASVERSIKRWQDRRDRTRESAVGLSNMIIRDIVSIREDAKSANDWSLKDVKIFSDVTKTAIDIAGSAITDADIEYASTFEDSEGEA